MKILEKITGVGMIVVVALCVVAISAPKVYAQDDGDYSGGCDYCDSGFDSSYTPSYDSDYYPSYDSSYTPSYDSSYSPEYDDSYAPGESYSPDYAYDTPEYDYADVPEYSSDYSSGFTPEYSLGGGYAVGFSSPIVQPQVSAPQQQQQSQNQSQGQTSTNVNSNPNTNTNTNINNINIAPVQQVPQTPQYPVQYVFPQPTCTITVGNGYNNTYNNGYNYGSSPMTLTWYSTNATSAYISPNVGSVGVSGSETVYPTGNQIYTMTVYGTGGTNTCSTTANYYVAPTPVVYSQPAAPYVTLSQIPYTGFDYGTFGDTIYWLALFAFAAALAYLAIYYQGGALSYATSLVSGNIFAKRSDDSEEEASEPVQTPAPEEEEAYAPAYTSVSVLPTQETSRITADSMIVARAADGTPRIVITRS